MRTRLAVALTAIMCGHAAALDNDSVVECRLVPDGAFESGGTGWLFTPEEQYEGDATAWAGIGIVNGTSHPSGGFDATTLALQVHVSAGFGGSPGRASARASASIPLQLTGTILRLRRCGGFEHAIMTGAGRSLDVSIRVRRDDGANANVGLYRVHTQPSSNCGVPITILGTLDANDPTLNIDLEPAGMSVGDQVELEISVSAAASSPLPCQFSETYAALLIDVVELCARAICAADFDGDGFVTGLDFDQYTAAFEDGETRTDFDGDGFITGLDFDSFVAAFEAGC